LNLKTPRWPQACARKVYQIDLSKTDTALWRIYHWVRNNASQHQVVRVRLTDNSANMLNTWGNCDGVLQGLAWKRCRKKGARGIKNSICHDQASFLIPLYQEVYSTGLEAINVMFEFLEDFETVQQELLPQFSRPNRTATRDELKRATTSLVGGD